MNKRLLILVCLLLSYGAASAYSRMAPDEHHFVALWGEVGYQTLLNQSNEVKSGPGVAPALGVGYRYLCNGFIFQLGIEGQFAYLTNNLHGADLKVPMIDTEGDDFTMHASVAGCHDVINAVQINVPLLLGYEYRHFYFLAGAQLGLNVWGNTQTRSTITTRAEYNRFIDIFEGMPNHDLLDNVTVSSPSYRMHFNSPSVLLHGEIGVRLDRFYNERGAGVPYHKYRLYLSAFVNYGVLNIHYDESLGSALDIVERPGEPLQFAVMPTMLSDEMMGKQVHPLTVGLKLTCLFELPKRPVCVICNNR